MCGPCTVKYTSPVLPPLARFGSSGRR
jgi:hypothetical protein